MSFRRMAGVAGLAFVVVFVVAQAVAGSLPQPKETGDRVISYLGEHATSLQITAALTAVGVFLSVVFLVGLWDAARDGEGRPEPWSVVGLVGGAVTATLNAVQGAVFGGIALGIHATASPDLAITVYRIGFTIGGATSVFAALFLTGFTLASWKTGFLPGWVRWLGALAAVLQAIASLAIASARTEFFVTTLAAFAASLLWVVAVSIRMLRQPAPA
jgi:hypothetical protein